MVTEIVTPRIGALKPPHEPAVAAQLQKMMPPGVPPIALFRTMVRNLPMAEAMTLWGSYELSRSLSLSLRDREIVIDRTCARCGCEYEWGVHVAFFAEKARLDRAQVRSLTHGGAGDACWTAERDRLLIRAVDALCDHRDIDDALWAAVRDGFDDREILDLTMLCGWYHAISFTARAARVPLEAGSPTFAGVA
ncbi:carboxymuconolactone decarboxylase family protein [Mycobacterium sp. 852002-51057_SCH5723018]|uniref:carboxymuconolactone decarboxylase family protein n=1 Tax=Mycobacterium sp. 852002-51057_SCH5723018 TaxID=1834094 RepID=UPI0007FD3244|nr:carboxymuconolactone decarboxylase family protein [Mycobacterium sp. 852002-51057_SCH5723018]OBG23460.1 carboxymuconolactone decarboxylase [Mycobacterium sp. 852002-51057_SCH5723018]